MQLIQNILSANQILTASLLSWFVAQVLKTIINFILLGKFQLERMWGDGGMPSAHSATVTAMVICGGLRGGYYHHARCYGRPARDRRAGKGAEPDDRPVDRCEREKRSLFAEYASEGNGRPHAAAGRGRRAARLAGGLFVPSRVMKCGLLQKLLCICNRAAQNGCGRKSERTNA